MNKEFIKNELKESKYRLSLFEKEGLKIYENHKELVYEMIVSKLREDIKYFEEQLK